MTREDIILMAQEADIKFKTDVFCSDFCDGVYEDDLERFAALVASAERERFIEVLRQLHDSYSLASDSNAIRARGDNK